MAPVLVPGSGHGGNVLPLGPSPSQHLLLCSPGRPRWPESVPARRGADGEEGLECASAAHQGWESMIRRKRKGFQM